MKPQIVRKVPATPDAIVKAFGSRIGDLFIPNPKIDEYAVVLRLPDTKVILGGEPTRALREVAALPGPLIIASDSTLEAREVAGHAGCDVLTRREFGWTDAGYQRIRRNDVS